MDIFDCEQPASESKKAVIRVTHRDIVILLHVFLDAGREARVILHRKGNPSIVSKFARNPGATKCNDDDEVDDLYEQIYRELLTYMIQDPSTIQRATYLLWVAHDLERIADRATNIAERVIFLVTGKLTAINVSKY